MPRRRRNEPLWIAKSLSGPNSPSERVNITPPQILSYKEQRMRGTASRRTRDGILVASGAALMLVVLLVLQLLVGSGPPSTKTVTATVTTSNPNEQVADAYANHLLLLPFSSHYASALVSEYEENATIEWTGIEAAGTGNISGSNNIGIALGSFIGKFINFSISAKSQSIEAKGNVSVVNSTLDFQGHSSVVGQVNGMIVAQDVYEHIGSSWLITRETWNFAQFNEQFPFT